MVDGWHWVVASVAAVALIILVLLWYDTLRERPGWTIARATKRAAAGGDRHPGRVSCCRRFLPLWVGAGLIVVPLIVIGVMALAD